ncbi:hypothetical protein [Rubrivirga marina]|uniref:Uncharacterized protein n=1 Tax=Rubrivirga marina TaxID=1196024 RepID=A0A271J2Y3_9BACT|nr:hypothetical protein [Rubrivirga marina]PAP77852.1 hypothetical protein BSZ37_16090 [Rubrivirga marina]
MRLVVLIALLSPVAFGQSAPASAPDTTVADTATVAFLRLDRVADTLAAVRAERERIEREQAERQREEIAADVARAQAQLPHTEALGTTGAAVVLPGSWTGPVTVAEGELPDYALYTARNVNPASPLEGAVLRVERVTGLNALYRERWSKGQTTYGYHGASPVGPIAVPEGLGLEVSGPGTGGAVAFTQRGATLWAVAVEAPAGTWATHRADVLAILASVRLP